MEYKRSLKNFTEDQEEMLKLQEIVQEIAKYDALEKEGYDGQNNPSMN